MRLFEKKVPCYCCDELHRLSEMKVLVVCKDCQVEQHVEP